MKKVALIAALSMLGGQAVAKTETLRFYSPGSYDFIFDFQIDSLSNAVFSTTLYGGLARLEGWGYTGDDPSIVSGLTWPQDINYTSLSFSTDENGQLLSAYFSGELNQQFNFRYGKNGYSFEESFRPESYRFIPGTAAFVNVAPVPLPATAPLLVFGAAALMWVRRRKIF
ncbi:hypothetical protein EYC08_17785 [Tabrizicola sp. WMC-M-20]|nr:hypothetical protein EYC08_17785 [Tabrizicola sp. WMC-M-20]